MSTHSLLNGVVFDEVVAAKAPWRHQLKAGQVLQIVDLYGNQSVDCLFYNAHNPWERYSAQDTIARQKNIFLRKGSILISNEQRIMATVVESTVAYHDTIGGACSCESNSLRYGHHTKSHHSCVDNFLQANIDDHRGKRDLVSNINWFMNVPVEPNGALGIVDGISSGGQYVGIRAEMDCIVVVSNCPQINNPCNAFNPTPTRMIVME